HTTTTLPPLFSRIEFIARETEHARTRRPSTSTHRFITPPAKPSVACLFGRRRHEE
uniref:Uncharacterized protein n=1 Tax=Aegilops tauschii subsp. strangulata TaxID=200361 RepID=A0A453DC20_AEGTS